MGARVERATSRYDFPYGPHKLLDGDPATVWTSSSSVFPQEIVFAFAARDTRARGGPDDHAAEARHRPGMGRAERRQGLGEGRRGLDFERESRRPASRKWRRRACRWRPARTPISLAAPVRAKFLKLVVLSNHGSIRYAVMADVAVQEGAAPGYHAAAPAARGPGRVSLAGRPPAAPVVRRSCRRASISSRARRSKPRSPRARPKAATCWSWARTRRPTALSLREAVARIAAGSATSRAPPGDGRLDSAIYSRLTFWAVPPDAARPCGAAAVDGRRHGGAVASLRREDEPR